MKNYSPKVCNGFLYEESSAGSSSKTIPLESAAWYTWLDSHKSFRFEAPAGNFTVRKEYRSENWYWYAYHRKQGKLTTTCLGKTKDLTPERLQVMAQALHSSPVPAEKNLSQKIPTQETEAVSAEQILLTKLQVPPLPPHLVPRPALSQRLNATMQNKLTLLSAPVGFGKTTVLSEWAARSPQAVAWFALDESDNDPVRFWGYIIAALENIQPGVGEHALALLRSQQTLPIEAVITVLVNAVVVIPRDFALVLDDYHLITTPAIHQGLLFFLNHLPIQMHLLIASRIDPPLPLPKLRANCQLIELRAPDLRFTSQEVATLFSRLASLEISEEIVAHLEMLTEGWIAALQLAAISAQGQPDMAAFLKTFTGNNLYIFDYLANEVWQKISGTLQLFLLQVAIPERFNASLCTALTGQTDGQQILEQLERTNLFIVRLDNQRRWYRFHHLLREFLRERFSVFSPDDVKELHLRACTWHEQNGLVNEAIHHALRAGDSLKAATLVVSAGQRLVRHNEMATLAQWLEVLPDDLFFVLPRLCLLKGWLSITGGQVLASQEWLERAQQGIENNTSSPLPHTEQELATITGELAILRSHLAIFLGDVPRSLKWANQALNLIPERDLFLRSLGELNLGIASWLNDDIKAATRAMTRAEEIGQAANNLYVRLMAFCTLSHIQIEVGQLQRSMQICQRALQLVEEKKGEALSATAIIYISMGQIFYFWNDLEAADHSLQKSITLCKHWQHRELMIYCYAIMAQVKQARGDFTAALEMVQLAELSIQGNQPRYWIASAVSALQIQLALVQQNFALITQWQQTEMCSYVNVFEQQALARIALAQNQPEKALTILEKAFQRVEEIGRIGAMIDVRLLQAVAYQQQHATQHALRTLVHALTMAEPEGFIRPIVDAGLSLKELLVILAAEEKAPRVCAHSVSLTYVNTLIGVFESSAKLQASLPAPSCSKQAEPDQPERLHLSEREIEIIHFIVAGLSTQEIAQRIIITKNTAKWHIKNIYSKLHVHNRAQLIARVHESGIA
jgi:ATP/maltotriose-dependent transcriptional regulator MalT